MGGPITSLTTLAASRMQALNTDLIPRLIDHIGYDYLQRLDHWESSRAEKKLLYSLSLTSRVCKWQAYPYFHGTLECASWRSVTEAVSKIHDHNPPVELVKAHTVHLRLQQLSWVGDEPATLSAPLLKVLLNSLPKLRKVVLGQAGDLSWKDHLGNYPAVQDAIMEFISSNRLESLEIHDLIIPRNLHRYFGPALTSLVMSGVQWEESISGGSFTQNPAPLNRLRSLRVLSYSYDYEKCFAIHELTGVSEASLGGEVSFPLLESGALWGVDPWERLTVESLAQPGSFPELKKIVFLEGIEALRPNEVFPSVYGASLPDTGYRPMNALHTKFTCITLPADYLSMKAEIQPPLEKLLQMSNLTATTGSTVRKLILNLCHPPSAGTWAMKANGDPVHLEAEWVGIDKELATGTAWNSLEEVVLDMEEAVGNSEDIRKVAECLERGALLQLASAGVKVTVLSNV
ncbi:hypothetical protein BKA70DRAFT_1332951 [Coprinopsis sp. MPI-PUGE-AT-0042]|nr:hypothetical protein BKA70DRAFT_1332951 [Coprinopsis sp. MPI-PUGE-AT-0042]